MLTEEEWAELSPLLNNYLQRVKEYRSKYGVGLKEALNSVGAPACQKYFEITGYKETNFNAIWHHRLSAYGPKCSSCGHLLRTKEASFCANCGAKPRK